MESEPYVQNAIRIRGQRYLACCVPRQLIQQAFADLVVVELLVCSEDESCEFSDVRF